jgi:hypothetical protein
MASGAKPHRRDTPDGATRQALEDRLDLLRAEMSIALPPEKFRLIDQLVSSPNGRGWIRLCEILQDATKDSAIQASPGARAFLAVALELAGDSLSDSSGLGPFKEVRKLLSATDAAKRAPSGVDKAAVKRFHARLVASGADRATSDTATNFGISTRRVRKILRS